MNRVIAYVDAFNLYFGLKEKGLKPLCWLNLQKMVQSILKPHQTLECCKYFTSRVTGDANKHKRQNLYIEALSTLKNFNFYYGQFKTHPYECPTCGNENDIAGEKMTDVNIAVEMMSDAFFDKFDTALLISGDSDLCAPINSINKHFSNKKIIAVFPPKRVSNELKKIVSGVYYISEATLKDCQFEDNVKSNSGYNLMKPAKWK